MRSRAWRDAAGLSDLEFHLTPDQLDVLVGELHQLMGATGKHQVPRAVVPPAAHG